MGNWADRCVLSLEDDGIDCVPLFGYNHHLVATKVAGFHAHHECVEVIFCLRGDGLYQCGDREYPLRAGSVFVSAPDQLHRLKLYHKGLRMYWIQFRLPTRGFPILGLREDESDWLARKLKGIPLRLFAGDSGLKTAFGRLFRVYDEEKGDAVRRRILLKSAVLDLLTALLSLPFREPRQPKNGLIAEIVGEMEAEPASDYPLDGLARRANMSTSNLLTAFKRQTGLSPHAFLVQCRLERAKAELLKGVAVSAVSARVGYSSPQRFATSFRQAEGLSPRAWLKLRKS